jgi:hypothetical protein
VFCVDTNRNSFTSGFNLTKLSWSWRMEVAIATSSVGSTVDFVRVKLVLRTVCKDTPS